MDITYRTGDLMTAPESHLIHGTNCLGAYGSGVAGLMRAQYPKAYQAYRKSFESGELELGYISVVDCGPHTIINAATQYDYGGKPDVVYVDYENGIRTAFRRINEYAKQNPDATFAMPLIGAGLAGGSWPRIAQIITEEATDFEPVVYLYDGKIPS